MSTKIVMLSDSEAYKNARYQIEEYITIESSYSTRKFFTNPEVLDAKTYRNSCTTKDTITHYTELINGCFKIVDIVKGISVNFDCYINLGVFYVIVDENKDLEYIPESMATFVY